MLCPRPEALGDKSRYMDQVTVCSPLETPVGSSHGDTGATGAERGPLAGHWASEKRAGGHTPGCDLTSLETHSRGQRDRTAATRPEVHLSRGQVKGPQQIPQARVKSEGRVGRQDRDVEGAGAQQRPPLRPWSLPVPGSRSPCVRGARTDVSTEKPHRRTDKQHLGTLPQSRPSPSPLHLLPLTWALGDPSPASRGPQAYQWSAYGLSSRAVLPGARGFQPS